MHHLFVSKSDLSSSQCNLSADDFHYLSRVLRIKKGEVMSLCVSGECVKTVEVTALSNEVLKFKKLSVRNVKDDNLHMVTLFQCLPKGDKMSDIINHCTQLSCTTIVPVISSRSMVKLDQKKKESKSQRWNQVARQACMQSKQDILTNVQHPIHISEIDLSKYSLDTLLVPWEEEMSTSLKRVLQQNQNSKHFGIVVGPEGGLSRDEVQSLVQKGGQVVHLGRTILRSEIAAAVCISQCNYHFSV